jgi:transposase
VGLTDALDERRLELQQLLARWRLLDAQRAVLEARLAALVPHCPPAQLLTTVPEVNTVCAATIVAELGCPTDFTHYRQVLKLAGLNLDDRQSGTMQGRRRVSKHGRPMLRRQLYLLAGRWCQARGHFRADYLALRARGMSGTKAIATLARRLVPVLFAVLHRGEPFDLARWRANRHAPRRAAAAPPSGAPGRRS